MVPSMECTSGMVWAGRTCAGGTEQTQQSTDQGRPPCAAARAARTQFPSRQGRAKAWRWVQNAVGQEQGDTRMDAVASGTIGHYTFAEKRKRIFAIMAASSGNLVEWFDFYVYAFTAIYFAPSFFPKSDETVQLLQAAAVFAIGFLMRPIGGWMFGKIAARRGRKTSLVISVVMMCAGSLAIAILPTYSQIGLAAPLLLLLARMVQGLSVGGE